MESIYNLVPVERGTMRESIPRRTITKGGSKKTSAIIGSTFGSCLKLAIMTQYCVYLPQ